MSVVPRSSASWTLQPRRPRPHVLRSGDRIGDPLEPTGDRWDELDRVPDRRTRLLASDGLRSSSSAEQVRSPDLVPIMAGEGLHTGTTVGSFGSGLRCRSISHSTCESDDASVGARGFRTTRVARSKALVWKRTTTWSTGSMTVASRGIRTMQHRGPQWFRHDGNRRYYFKAHRCVGRISDEQARQASASSIEGAHDSAAEAVSSGG